MRNLRERKCPVCTVRYRLDPDFDDYRQNAPKGDPDRGWFCPNGHSLVYTESRYEQQRVRAEREEKRRRQAEHNVRALQRRVKHEEARVRGYKGYATKLAKAAKKGECFCCGEVFADVEKHMQEAHPDWTGNSAVEVEGVDEGVTAA